MNNRIKNIWNSITTNKQNSATDHIVLNIARATLAKSNVPKEQIFSNLMLASFAPTTNENKITNGWHQWKAVQLASICLSPNKLRNHPIFASFSEIELQTASHLINELFNDLKRFDEYCFAEYRETPILHDRSYAYIITRRDISPEQQVVQTAHVASRLGFYARFDMRNQHFIVFGVSNQDELRGWANFLTSKGVEYVDFFEPDNNMGLSSMATLPLRKSYVQRKRLFEGLELLSFSQK